MAYDTNNATNVKSANRDPITGEPGAHPVGTGIGAAAGATAGAAIGTAAATAAATGALLGTSVGPIGTAAGAIAGAIIGGVAGGLAGKGVAEAIDPTAEDAYWNENFRSRPYVAADSTYDAYRPAYRYGVDAYSRYEGKDFDAIEPELSNKWSVARGSSSLDWTNAREASRDSYNRLRQRYYETEQA